MKIKSLMSLAEYCGRKGILVSPVVKCTSCEMTMAAYGPTALIDVDIVG